jgi:hypothetical protein
MPLVEFIPTCGANPGLDGENGAGCLFSLGANPGDPGALENRGLCLGAKTFERNAWWAHDVWSDVPGSGRDGLDILGERNFQPGSPRERVGRRGGVLVLTKHGPSIRIKRRWTANG